jgi:trehalose/maltose hydrolase-like predicted phosphorylase
MAEWSMTAPLRHGAHDSEHAAPWSGSSSWPTDLLEETYEALVFDWDGTVVPDRNADATGARGRVEALSDAGVHIFIVSGTHVENVDGQLQARPHGRGHLFLCCNRGSEVFQVTSDGPQLLDRRTASADEDGALDLAAAQTVARLRDRGLEAQIVANRLNRRKIDIIAVPEWADPKKADIGRLLEAVMARLAAVDMADLSEVIELAAGAARGAGLADPRITSDVKHVEIGLTDKSDSARWAAHWLAQRGITGELILIAGDEFGPIGGATGSDSFMIVDALARAPVVSVGVEPGGVPDGVMHLGGGPARFAELLDVQVARRADHRVPRIDRDPGWVLPLPPGLGQARVAESLGWLGNGWAGTRGSLEEDGPDSTPLFLVGGVYDEAGRILPGPLWTGLDQLIGSHPRAEHRRLLDLRAGTLVRGSSTVSDLRSIRFVSASSPHVMALRGEAPAGQIVPGMPLRPPTNDQAFTREENPRVDLAFTGSGEQRLAMASQQRVAVVDGHDLVERLAAWAAPRAGVDSSRLAGEYLEQAQALGFDALLAEHRCAWAQIWEGAEVVIEGDHDDAAQDQLAARFAVFHLLSAAATHGEAAVGARGLTGHAYEGHVFWDADVFVLPALAAIRPASARAMLEYRIRRLAAARELAMAHGRAGARFPWESAGDGRDVTPSQVPGPRGTVIPIVTGANEEHIVADVAWAAAEYAAWTGDSAFLAGAGRDLVVETARYWASRIRTDSAGRGHLDQVMGPDEYHPLVDDNAYTNGMARWNLRRGADVLTRAKGDPEEAETWRTRAGSLVDGWDPARGLYEQFDGYFDLEPLLMTQIGPPPLAIDMVLGSERVARSQLIKQADVLMLYHLVPDELVPNSLAPSLGFYEPRTAHGSSLSPAISAALLARAGEPERALELFRLAARLDLEDLTGTTAGGLHLATMGGVWQALAYGFLGLRAQDGFLAIDPSLPQEWSALELRFQFHGRRVNVRAEHDAVTVRCDGSLDVCVSGHDTARCEEPGRTFTITGRGHPKGPP